MPTKYPRRRCALCEKRHVSWKMPSACHPEKTKRIFFCWSCAAMMLERFIALEVFKPPSKSTLLKKAFSIKKKPKQESF